MSFKVRNNGSTTKYSPNIKEYLKMLENKNNNFINIQNQNFITDFKTELNEKLENKQIQNVNKINETLETKLKFLENENDKLNKELISLREETNKINRNKKEVLSKTSIDLFENEVDFCFYIDENFYLENIDIFINDSSNVDKFNFCIYNKSLEKLFEKDIERNDSLFFNTNDNINLEKDLKYIIINRIFDENGVANKYSRESVILKFNFKKLI